MFNNKQWFPISLVLILGFLNACTDPCVKYSEWSCSESDNLDDLKTCGTKLKGLKQQCISKLSKENHETLKMTCYNSGKRIMSLEPCQQIQLEENWIARICSKDTYKIGFRTNPTNDGSLEYTILGEFVQNFDNGKTYITPKLYQGKIVDELDFWTNKPTGKKKFEGTEIRSNKDWIYNITAKNEILMGQDIYPNEVFRVFFNISEKPELKNIGINLTVGSEWRFVDETWSCTDVNTHQDWSELFESK